MRREQENTKRESVLISKRYFAFRISQLLDRYETEVLSVLKEPATQGGAH